jgi:GAF domain-containing protein
MNWEPSKLEYSKIDGFYQELTQEFQAIRIGHWLADSANLSALLNHHLPNLNWVGFYWSDDFLKPQQAHELPFTEPTLILGAFQGYPACVLIPFSKGVCGKAARTQKMQLIADVHEFPGHIACDSRSRSELVIPLLRNGKTIGVLDLDSPLVNRFSEADGKALSFLGEMLLG